MADEPWLEANRRLNTAYLLKETFGQLFTEPSAVPAPSLNVARQPEMAAQPEMPS